MTKDYTPEEIARQQPHRKYDDPSDTPAIGEFGPNKRMRRGADLHGAGGHKSATNKRKAGTFVGYDAFISTLGPNYHWAGDINHISIKETPPPFIIHTQLEPAGTSPGPVGLNAVLRSKDTLPNLTQVIADPGLTEKRGTFNRPLHQLRIDVVKQYHTKVPKPEPIKAGRHQQKLIAYAGMFLAHWTPQHPQTKPPDATERELTEQSTKASKYRWKVNAVLPDGSLQAKCPQCTGQASTNAKTWALRNHPHKPRPELPASARIDDEYCCQGMVTIKVEHLDTYQRIPWVHPRLVHAIPQQATNRKRQRHAQRPRRTQRRLVPSPKQNRLQPRSTSYRHRSQPTRTEPLPPPPTTKDSLPTATRENEHGT